MLNDDDNSTETWSDKVNAHEKHDGYDFGSKSTLGNFWHQLCGVPLTFVTGHKRKNHFLIQITLAISNEFNSLRYERNPFILMVAFIVFILLKRTCAVLSLS